MTEQTDHPSSPRADAAPTVGRGDGAATRERIVSVASEEIERTGILGLRMADVARAAGVSEPLIYKYFGDRNGLLTEVLAQIWHDQISDNLATAQAQIEAMSGAVPTAEAIAAAKVRPSDEDHRRQRWLRIQILAASCELPELRSRLGDEQRRVQVEFERMSAQVRERLGSTGFAVDARVEGMYTMAASLGLVLNDLLGDDGLDDDEARSFWEAYHRLVGFDDPRLEPLD